MDIEIGKVVDLRLKVGNLSWGSRTTEGVYIALRNECRIIKSPVFLRKLWCVGEAQPECFVRPQIWIAHAHSRIVRLLSCRECSKTIQPLCDRGNPLDKLRHDQRWNGRMHSLIDQLIDVPGKRHLA